MIVKSEDLPDLGGMIPHLALLNAGSFLQNTRALTNDQASNKLFELLIGLAALNIPNTKVELDDPDHSKGDNPDVVLAPSSIRVITPRPGSHDGVLRELEWT